MPNDSRHAAEYLRETLEVNLQGAEGVSGAVKSISATKNQFTPFTKAEHDFLKRVAAGSLRVVIDESGATPVPSGMTLVCRGTAWIELEQKKVALFRT